MLISIVEDKAVGGQTAPGQFSIFNEGFHQGYDSFFYKSALAKP